MNRPRPKPDFDQDLQALRTRLLRLGGLVEDMVVRATRSMVQRDEHMAQQTTTLGTQVEAQASDIHTRCVAVMDRWRPGGAPLRILTFTLTTVPHLSKIGQLAAAVSERARSLASDGVSDPTVEIGDMGTMVSEMLSDAIDAFVRQDASIAEAVVNRDDALDLRYERLRGERMQAAQDASDPAELRRAIHTLAVAKYMERMGDHATAIAENVVELVISQGALARDQTFSD